MNYATQKAILDATLTRPTAGNLSEADAHDRVQAIRRCTYIGAANTTPAGPIGEAFTRDWQRMMEREREWN